MIDTESQFSDVLTAMRVEQGKLVVHRQQDVEPYLDLNKAAQADAVGGWNRTMGTTRRKIGSIPNIVAERWMREGFNVFTASQRELRKKLDEPEWSYLKTVPGKIGQRSRHI